MILPKNAAWTPAKEVRFVTVRSGRLWVSRTGDPEDRLLVAGDSLELKGRGWVFQALGGTPCAFTTSTSSPTGPWSAILWRSLWRTKTPA